MVHNDKCDVYSSLMGDTSFKLISTGKEFTQIKVQSWSQIIVLNSLLVGLTLITPAAIIARLYFARLFSENVPLPRKSIRLTLFKSYGNESHPHCVRENL